MRASVDVQDIEALKGIPQGYVARIGDDIVDFAAGKRDGAFSSFLKCNF